ncbi:2Fe-2S iron-sulfur cluster-binding protein [Halovenus salina]|uniref:2Fe-2S iron-sulfur cluster-binding protein n=1 Tax=Halovenus salina TaxID=1510225 RepID=A0ABD5W1P5_9EURY|nr:2Fe-2S iron-sulfur cluster-binding protein [Halovenus salina]
MPDSADSTGDERTGETYTCEFVDEGVEIEVPGDEYILEAALDEGLDIQYSCLQGVCASCGAKVDGEVEQSEEHALTQWEKQQGYALLCVSYPRSDLTIHSNEEP